MSDNNNIGTSSKIKRVQAMCPICGKDKGLVSVTTVDKPCRICGTRKHKSIDDFIWVETKAGKRGTQRVRKIRKSCLICDIDIGYRYIRGLSKCHKCAIKGRKISPPSHNFFAARKKVTEEVTTRSTYESFYAEYLISKGIRFKYEPKWFELPNGQRYLPDFYIYTTDEYIEIKGQMRDEDIQKLQLFKDTYPNLKLRVIQIAELKELGYRLADYKLVKNFSIKGSKWQLIVLDSNRYNRRFGRETHAMCVSDNRKIYINKDSFGIDIIRHELGHAFFHECNTSSSELSVDAIEEMFCELLGEHGEEIMELASEIVSFLVPKLENKYGKTGQ